MKKKKLHRAPVDGATCAFPRGDRLDSIFVGTHILPSPALRGYADSSEPAVGRGRTAVGNAG